MIRFRKVLPVLGFLSGILIVYVVAYLATSEITGEPIESAGHIWYTRTFGEDWQVQLFKPLLGLESAWRDGDFSWVVRRVK